MRAIADSVGAYLMSDMAHISGLVAAGARRGERARAVRVLVGCMGFCMGFLRPFCCAC